MDAQNGLAWDTPFTFTLYGDSGTYTHPDARSAHPVAGVSSGTVLTTAVFTENAATDGDWYVFGPFKAAEGELFNGKRIFKLSVVGGPEPPFTSGIGFADRNIYNVILSTSSSMNSAPTDARIFAFSWTFLIPSAAYNVPPRLFPFVDSGVAMLIQHNWDYDNTAAGTAGMTITTPSRIITVPDADVSSDAEERISSYSPRDTERDTTWAVSCWAQTVVGDNLVTFWATDENGRPLAIFARSTNVAPP